MTFKKSALALGSVQVSMALILDAVRKVGVRKWGACKAGSSLSEEAFSHFG